ILERRHEDLASTQDLEQDDIASTHELEQEDRLSSLPDDILISILNRLKLLEAARISILSRRWRDLFHFRSRIVIDVGSFHQKYKDSELTQDDLVQINANMVKVTKTMLSHKIQCPIRLLRVKFNLVEESIDIIRCVDSAMANQEIAALHFSMHSEIVGVDCTQHDKMNYGRRFLGFFDAGPHAFGSLSYLHMDCVALSINDMANVLGKCSKLLNLSLYGCDFGVQSVLKIEHPQLIELTLSYCTFERVQLACLPNLIRLTCQVWSAPENQYPLSFDYVPQLLTLILSHPSTIFHKKLQLSEFLSNAMIRELDLDFSCEMIWIQPEAPKLAGRWLQNLQFLCLRRIHDECELDWTLFFLEAAPLIRKMHVEVWDHTICGHEENEPKELTELYQYLYRKKSDYSLTWETPKDLKHYCLKELIINGYQLEEKFTRYARRVMEVAVNLERITLLDKAWCERCKFSPSTRYPRTEEERFLTRKQILGSSSRPIKICIVE
ncbi:unnamed protein product, partial [Urochloa humidicola]